MNLNQIPHLSTIIAPSYLHPFLQDEIMRSKTVHSGIKLITLQSFINQFHNEEIDSVETIIKCRKVLAEQTFQIYKNIVLGYDFLKQCVTFVQEMILYDISLDQLPTNSVSEQELFQIIETIFSIVKADDRCIATLHHLSQNNVSNTFIIDANPTLKDHMIYQKLQTCGVTYIQVSQHTFESFRYSALNKRKEVELYAQFLIEKGISASDVNILVYDTSYLTLVSQIFEKYEIPHTILSQSSKSEMIQCMIAWIQFYIHADAASFLKVCRYFSSRFTYVDELIFYLDNFQIQIFDSFDFMKKNIHNNSIVSQKEIEHLIALEEKANEAKAYILPIIESLLKKTTLEEIISYIYELTVQEYEKYVNAQLQVLQQVQNICYSFLQHYHEKEDLSFLIELLDGLTNTISPTVLKGAIVSLDHQPVYYRDWCVMFGCTQKNYPKITTCDGIFDEAYVAKIKNYPKRRIRYEYDIHRHQQLLLCYKQIYASYPIGNYNGKSNEGALELEQFLNGRFLYKQPFEYINEHNQSWTLNKTYAEELYQKNGVLKGSVSAFEKYQKCPFSYFLKYGLKIKEPIQYDVAANRIGSLVHYVLEELTRNYQKEYYCADEENLKSILLQELSEYTKIYPKVRDASENIIYRILQVLKSNLEFLASMEQASAFTPSEFEMEVNKIIHTEKTQLHIKGFIDRVDKSENYMRIIDYKSSKKQLQMKFIEQGLQLQLLTYAWFLSEIYQNQMVSMHYYSLKSENINVEPLKIDRRKKQILSLGKDEFYKEWKKSKKLQGWYLDEALYVLDVAGDHHNSLKTKDNNVTTKDIYDLDKIKEAMLQIYTEISNEILSGKIACRPVDTACDFCTYKPICRYHSSNIKQTIEPIIQMDLQKEEEELDATVE